MLPMLILSHFIPVVLDSRALLVFILANKRSGLDLGMPERHKCNCLETEDQHQE